MDLRIVEFIQGFSNSNFNLFFQSITLLGDELVFLLLAAFLYWCVNKAFAYRLMVVFLVSVFVNQGLKYTFKRPRPYTLESVTSIGEVTHGYAFPSGHAQNSTILALFVNAYYKHQKGLKYVLFSLVLLVAFSRVYLGQHYVSDVLTGILVASLIYFVHLRVYPKIETLHVYYKFAVFPVLLLYVLWIDDKNAYVSFATLLGVTIGYTLEKKYVDYDVKATLATQVMKYVLGILIALLLKEGLKMILPYTEATSSLNHLLDFIRYFILSIWMSFGSMLMFKKLFKPYR